MSACLFCSYRTSTQQNCLIDLTASVTCMVPHLTSYCISSGMADSNCVAYSNTVEIFFTQREQLQTVKS